MDGNIGHFLRDIGTSVLGHPKTKYIVSLFRGWANTKVIHEMTIHLTNHLIGQSMVTDKR